MSHNKIHQCDEAGNEKYESEDDKSQDGVGGNFAANVSIEQAHGCARFILARTLGHSGWKRLGFKFACDMPSSGSDQPRIFPHPHIPGPLRFRWEGCVSLSRVNLVVLWHMHQPQYKDPETGNYLLPWTRLHALKDYWGMVKILEEFPGVHMTFNFVPLLAEQIEEYASGKFKESWFDIAFAGTETLTVEQKREIVERAFQVNDIYVHRWPRFAELRSQVQSAGAEASVAHFSVRDWRDLQVLSQLAWTDEEYFVEDSAIAKLSEKGKNYTAADSALLQERQQKLLGAVLPEYRRAEARGQIEISTTPYYHPILPLLCDTDIARVSNPHTPLPHPAFRYPEDAREQLLRSRKFHERVFGKPPAGLWPSEGSVSDQALEIAMELGFKWFATDEGVLGRTRNVGFWRDPSGYPENGPELYTPWRFKRGKSGDERIFSRSLFVGPGRICL